MTRSHFLWWALVLAETLAFCDASEKDGVLHSSRIEIKGPAGLAGELTHHGALFGSYFFGETIEKKLYYTKRPLCNGQLPDTPDYIKQDGYFLLVDRGECSFVEKIRSAQKDGALAVFIADDRCLCSEDGLCEANVDEPCEKVEPVMDDDGSGSDIKIPSMLLLKSDADRLRDEIVSGSVIETSISFPVPKATDGRTEYTLFTTPGDPSSQQFLDSFLEAALAFGSKAVFRPRMMLSDGTQKGCRQYDDSHVPCKGHCSNYGRYCESPSSYDKAHYDDKGTKVVVESMRRTCIWNIYGKVDGIGKEWWGYVELWMLQCSFSQYSTSCAESIYNRVGIDKEEVEMCMKNSGDFREDVQNTLMETSLSDIAKYQVNFAPTFVVNGAIISGALSFGNAMSAICSTYENSERPAICDKWVICSEACSNEESCILWGDKQECAAYKAPYLSNDGTEFDDDYLRLGFDDEDEEDDDFTNSALETSTTYFLTPETKRPIPKDWNGIEGQTEHIFDTKNESPYDQSNNIPTLQKKEVTLPPKASDPQYTPQTSGAKFSDTKEISDGQHDFVETIEIYEGSSSELAMGLGIGFGSAFLLLFIWFMISRERERQVDDLMASGRRRRRGRRSRLFKSRRRHYYDDYSDDSSSSRETDDYFSDDDEFSDEEEHYNDRGKVKNHHESDTYYSKRRKRDRMFSKKSKRKSRQRLLRRKPSSEEEMPINGRFSSIRRQINADEFPSEYDKNDGDRGDKTNSDK